LEKHTGQVVATESQTANQHQATTANLEVQGIHKPENRGKGESKTGKSVASRYFGCNCAKSQYYTIKAVLVVLGLACWPLVPKIAGLNPAEAIGFFRRKNPQHAFLWRGSKAICPMLQICGMLKNPVIYMEVGIAGQIDWPFLAQKRACSL
jgi:hypothetical protein